MLVKNMANDFGNIYPTSYKKVLGNFFLNIGDADVTETDDIKSADAFFIMGSMGQAHFHSKLADFEYVTLRENKERLQMANTLLRKPVIIFWDTHGPESPKDYEVDLGSLKKNDIPVGWASLPSGHKNTQEFIGVVSATEYRLIRRYARRPKSLMIIGDSFDFIQDEMREVIPLFESVLVTNMHTLPEGFDEFPNLSHAQFGADQIWDELLKVEYVLSTRTEMGLEMMGVEGGFSGARPIYPDTPFYRDIFQRCEGVAFFDAGNVVESIKEIVAAPNTWIAEHHADFVREFSAENTIPQFWKNVVNILG